MSEDGLIPTHEPPSSRSLTAGELRRLIKALHRVLRDGEGNSSLIERFDELTKLLYCKVRDEQRPTRGDGPRAFVSDPNERDGTVAARLRGFLADLVRQKPSLFPERFAQFRLSATTARQLADLLAPVQIFSPHQDLKGLAYEEVIRNTFDKGDHQQFFTPRPVVEFLVQMLAGSGPGMVCDPACGTGGFLMYVDRFWKQRRRKTKVSLLGFEVDERLAWVAGINLDMHGAAHFDLRHVSGAGSLGPELQPFFGRMDAIVTNPPFGSDLADPTALAAFELGKGRTSRRRGVLFIERCLDLLKPGGWLAIVLDDSVLNGPANRDTRALVLERSDPLAIVSLPETAFMPYATVKASILFARKKNGRRRQAAPNRRTFFAHAEVVGRKANGDPLFRLSATTNRLELDSDFPEILRAWTAGPAEAERNGAGQRHVFWACLPEVHDVPFARDGYRLDLAYHHPARQEALRALDASPYPLKSLLEVCELRTEALVPATDLPDEELTYLGLANIEAYTGRCIPVVVDASSLKSTVRRFRAGDLLFAKMRPELRKACLIPDDIEEGYASAECLVLVPKADGRTGQPELLPDLLALLLRSDLIYGQLVHLVIGIGRPRLSKGTVLNVRLPCPPRKEQQRLLERYRRSEQAAQALMAESEQASAKARRILAEAHQGLMDDLFQSPGRS